MECIVTINGPIGDLLRGATSDGGGTERSKNRS